MKETLPPWILTVSCLSFSQRYQSRRYSSGNLHSGRVEGNSSVTISYQYTYELIACHTEIPVTTILLRKPALWSCWRQQFCNSIILIYVWTYCLSHRDTNLDSTLQKIYTLAELKATILQAIISIQTDLLFTNQFSCSLFDLDCKK